MSLNNSILSSIHFSITNVLVQQRNGQLKK